MPGAMGPPGYGLTVPLHGHTVAEMGEIAREAEALGYTDLWSVETTVVDGFAPLVFAAAHTSTVRLGTAVVPSFTRGPATLALSAAGCEQAAPGRFVLGIGCSTAAMVEGWNGILFERPLSSVRDAVLRVRLALAGERMPLRPGDRGGFRLDMPPGPHVPIFVAALRPRMLRLAGAIADGVILNFLPVEAVPAALAEVRRGAESASRNADDIDVVARLTVCADGDTAAIRAAARRILAGYVTSPFYQAALRWMGLGRLLDPVVLAWDAGDRATALGSISDELIDRLLVIGDAGACRRRIAAYRDAGVRVPCLAPFSGEAEMEARRASIRCTMRELAPAAAAAGAVAVT
jgi:probable F420-dependent oxidoreductase